jgi:hypothetical protein
VPSNTDDLSSGVTGSTGSDPSGLDPLGRVERLVSRASRSPWAWVAYVSYASVVCVLHFEYGLEARFYWTVWWWDLLTHAASGFGVAALVPLVGLWRDRSLGDRLLLTAGALVAVGAGFEVYERLFRTFWHEWTLATYVEDTVVDVVVDAVGGVGFVLARAVWIRLRGS